MQMFQRLQSWVLKSNIPGTDRDSPLKSLQPSDLWQQKIAKGLAVYFSVIRHSLRLGRVKE